MPPTSRRRPWVVWALCVYGAAAAVILFIPISFADIVHAIAGEVTEVPGLGFFGSGWIEFVANVVLFVPLGFLLTLLFRHPWIGAIVAVLASAGVEIVQIVIPNRQATVRDVISNAIGAAIGAFLAWLIVRHRERKTR